MEDKLIHSKLLLAKLSSNMVFNQEAPMSAEEPRWKRGGQLTTLLSDTKMPSPSHLREDELMEDNLTAIKLKPSPNSTLGGRPATPIQDRSPGKLEDTSPAHHQATPCSKFKSKRTSSIGSTTTSRAGRAMCPAMRSC